MQSKGAERVTSGRNEKARTGWAVFCDLLPVAKGGIRPNATFREARLTANSGLPENQVFNKASAIIPEKVVSTGPVRKTDPTPSH